MAYAVRRKLLEFQASTSNKTCAGKTESAASPRMPKPRPKYLNLMQIRLPVPGVISIMHRVSGAALFLLIPLLLYLLQTSLESQQGFASLKSAFAGPLAKLVLIGLLWAFLHHFCAGIRYLALDLDIGTDLAAARASSWAVIVVSVALTLACGVLIW